MKTPERDITELVCMFFLDPQIERVVLVQIAILPQGLITINQNFMCGCKEQSCNMPRPGVL